MRRRGRKTANTEWTEERKITRRVTKQNSTEITPGSPMKRTV